MLNRLRPTQALRVYGRVDQPFDKSRVLVVINFWLLVMNRRASSERALTPYSTIPDKQTRYQEANELRSDFVIA